MKRQEYTAAAEIDGAPIGTVTKYAHNTAKRAAVDLLRPHARGGYWHQGAVMKDDRQTVIDFQHDDGRAARVIVNRPEAGR